MSQLLPQILHQLDTELARLHALRQAVQDLGQPTSLLLQNLAAVAAKPAAVEPAPAAQPTPESQATVQPRAEAKVKAQPKPRIVRPAARRVAEESKATKQREVTALTSVVPAGPVLVSAQALQRERQRVAASKVPTENVSLAPVQNPDSVARDLAARWLSGSAARPA